MISTLEGKLTELKEELLQLRPSGRDGFEGLVATALAALTGLTFRLAKSGLQFGRDASTPRARFAVAMEAKRYAEPLRLEDIAGKVWIASNELESDVDLWVLCATSELGDGALSKLEEMLEDRGISLLVLDWTTSSLPRLAALLAIVSMPAGEWFQQHTSPAVASKMNEALTAIAADESLLPVRMQLLKDASAEFVGLAALTETNRSWCNRVFSRRMASRQAFGQYLTVLGTDGNVVARPTLDAMLAKASSSISQKPSCVAVIGPEGSGKSWLVARHWATATDQPILIIGGAKTAHLFDSTEPLRTLARLIAYQSECDPSEGVDRWWRRLRRWRDRRSSSTSDRLRFLIVIDGLNERAGMPWAECITRLALEASKLDCRLVVTCRERYWAREVAPRLSGIDVSTVMVGVYNTEELTQVLRYEGVDAGAIPDTVRTFISNPRICSVAIALLKQLSVQADELTIERLLLEYWRSRLAERGDLVAHNVRDFDKLLRSHAKAFRSSPGLQFDRDDWREHSGAARRGDGRSVENDLTDIEEGAFLRVVDGRDGFYEFKPETVPFALGLLVARELSDELSKPNHDPAEVLDSIVEEVRGFDLVAEVLRSAAGIACYDVEYPRQARSAVISAWINLQNNPDFPYETLLAYVSTCPEAVFDATEIAFADPPGSAGRELLLSAIIRRYDRPKVVTEGDLRIDRWLRRWCRTPRRVAPLDEHELSRLDKQRTRIAEKLDQLTASEREFVRTCDEVDTPEKMQLDLAAARLMAGRPQAKYADCLFAWAFVYALTRDLARADAELSWAIRLNRVDFPALEGGLRSVVAAVLSVPHSDVARQAAATALRMLGTQAASAEAERIQPDQRPGQWRLVEQFCETDPFDPASLTPSNLKNAVEAASKITAEEVWKFVSTTVADGNIEMVTPALARFRPESIVPHLRAIAKTVVTRSGLALRQLSLQLPALGPLFDEQTLLAVLAGYRRVLEEPSIIDAADQPHVAVSILRSLLPHYPAPTQLRLYLELPENIPDWYACRDVFAPLESSVLEAALLAAETSAIRLRRTLFFATAHKTTLSDESRAALGRALRNTDPLIVGCASGVAYFASDPLLDEIVITCARQAGKEGKRRDDDAWRDRAVTAAVTSLGRFDDIDLIAPRFLGRAVAEFGGTLESNLESAIDVLLDKVLSPIQAAQLKSGQLVLEVRRKLRPDLKRMDETESEDGESNVELLHEFAKEISGSRQGIDEFHTRQIALRDAGAAYIKALDMEGAEAIARDPDVEALKLIASHHPHKVTAWASRILKETSRDRLANAKNFALGLAESLAGINPNVTAALFTHVRGLRSPVSIVVGDASIPLEIKALFSGGESPPLTTLRHEVLSSAATDADLETLVFAAEESGLSDWLSEWIRQVGTSDAPGDVARALTVEGFRNSNHKTSLLLARDWGAGFLGYVATRARHAYDRNIWARTWFARAASAETSEEFWRWSELCIGISDVRAFNWFDLNVDTNVMRLFGRPLYERIAMKCKRRTNKRKETLFGLRKPSRILAADLRLASELAH